MNPGPLAPGVMPLDQAANDEQQLGCKARLSPNLNPRGSALHLVSYSQNLRRSEVWPNGVWGRVRFLCFCVCPCVVSRRVTDFEKWSKSPQTREQTPCVCLGRSCRCSVSRTVLACSPSTAPYISKSRRMVQRWLLRALKKNHVCDCDELGILNFRRLYFWLRK